MKKEATAATKKRKEQQRQHQNGFASINGRSVYPNGVRAGQEEAMPLVSHPTQPLVPSLQSTSFLGGGSGTWPQVRRPSYSTPDDSCEFANSAQTTLLLRLGMKPEESNSVDVVAATLVDSTVNGVFYERNLDEVIVLDAAKKLLYRIKNNENENHPSGGGQTLGLLDATMTSAAIAAERQKRRQRVVQAAAAR